MAEANGQSLPLGFIFSVGTDGTAEEGAKGRVLDDFLGYFKTRCPNVKFTLSDKEKCEIDACQRAFPDAKHQCCIWHMLHYIEGRLAKDEATIPYDPRLAHGHFSFIDPTWCPGVAADPEVAKAELESGGAHPRREKDVEEEREEDRQVSAKP